MARLSKAKTTRCEPSMCQHNIISNHPVGRRSQCEPVQMRISVKRLYHWLLIRSESIDRTNAPKQTLESARYRMLVQRTEMARLNTH